MNNYQNLLHGFVISFLLISVAVAVDTDNDGIPDNTDRFPSIAASAACTEDVDGFVEMANKTVNSAEPVCSSSQAIVTGVATQVSTSGAAVFQAPRVQLFADFSVLEGGSLQIRNIATPVRAFPGAEGFGANATGGRNGVVVKVSNLNASGSGSLQAALNLNQPRIIVFAVSGVITADINIPFGNVSIAGQTAPGAGITIYGRLTCDYDNRPGNIIMRHIRIRANHDLTPGVANNQYDGLQCSRSSNLIFDHIAVSGGRDESVDLYSATDVTVQWSAITRADPDGDDGGHHFGLLNGPDGGRISVLHNIFAHNLNRNPAIATGPAEIINNLVYNVRHGFIHHNPATGDFNIVGNYYKQGPNGSLFPFFFDDENTGTGSPPLSYYMNDNYVDDPGDLTGRVDDPWLLPFTHSSFDSIDFGWDSSVASNTTPHTMAVAEATLFSSQVNVDLLLAQAGAFPRDGMALADNLEIQDRTGDWGKRIPADLMEGLTATTPPLDTDNDGMPDSWELSQGLQPAVADHNTVMASGYTAIEEYINQLADQLLR